MRSSLPYFSCLRRRLRLTGRIASLKGDIIDETRLAELCRGEKPDRSLAARRDGAKGFGMTRFEIVRDETGRGNSGPGSIERGINRNSPIDVLGAAAKRRMKAWRKRTLFWRQKDIARRQSQAIGLAHGGHAQNLGLEIEIVRHSRHDLELLKILFAKHRDIRAALVEEFCHDGRDAGKM